MGDYPTIHNLFLFRLPVGRGGVINSPRFWFFFPCRKGILRNPDRTRTRTWTRTRRKPGLVKNPDSCSDSRLRNPDSTIENPDSKSKIPDSMKLDSDNIRNPEYIPIFNCLSETYNRNSQILR